MVNRSKLRDRRFGSQFRAALLLFLICALLFSFAACTGDPGGPTVPPTTPPATTEPTTAPTEQTQPTEPTEETVPYIVSSAKIGVTGDMLIHTAVINAMESGGEYDFNSIFRYIAPYYERYDYMVANLEVTFGGTKSGEYRGYPGFNCPDSLAAALKSAGVDMVLTANNHTYDTRSYGMHRTLEVLDAVGLEHIGTRDAEETPSYLVKEINGIRVGMACYTYETTQNLDDGKKSLNGIPLTVEDSKLLSSFRYWDLEDLYATVEADLAAMKEDGADVTMVYIHWGDEYKLKQNSRQEEIAQQLCELGVDVIVGGHPHVVEPFETLVAENGHRTYCIYSTGNAVSNQRRYLMNLNTGNTEDGLIFEVELELWNDGSVKIAEIGAVPTWVNCYWKGGDLFYDIIPLDPALESWREMGVSDLYELRQSYARTMAILGDGINACREAMGVALMPGELD